MLDTSKEQVWYRPIDLLGEDDFGPDQYELTKTPLRRGKFALQIPEAVAAIYEYCIPFRQGVYERGTVKSMQPKLGHDDP